MHGRKTSANALGWAAFLASYLIICVMILVPTTRQPDIAASAKGITARIGSKN